MSEKIFVGYTKTISTQFGEITSISFNAEDRKKLEQYANEAGYTTIKIMNNRKGGKYAEIDTWSLNKPVIEVKPTPKVNEELDEINLDEIPF